MMPGLLQDQNMEKQIQKQIGCMSGFLQIFDRQQTYAGKRIYSTKRLLPSTGVAASPEPVKYGESPVVSREFEKSEPLKPVVMVVPASPDSYQSSPAANGNGFSMSTPPKSPLLPLPLFEVKDETPKSSWKFCKEMPRLSLDSRATVDSKGSLCPREIRTDRSNCTNSPSVIARLMGLEPLPSSDSPSNPETIKKPELRRSASESRVSRDLFNSRFIDGSNFQVKEPIQKSKQSMERNTTNNNVIYVSNNNALDGRVIESMEYSSSRNLRSESPRTSPWNLTQQRRSFFDSADIFPEPKQTTASMYGDFDKKLKMRGINEQSQDLETLKHILEALQLKGLLHSKRPSKRDGPRNFVYDRNLASNDSKAVLMKPWRSPSPASNRRFGNDSGGTDRSGRSPVRTRNAASPTQIESSLKSSNSILKRRPLSIETQRKGLESSDSRRSSPINSPKLTPKRNASDHKSLTNRSPRSRKPTDAIHYKEFKNVVAEDESSSISGSTNSTSSQTDTERCKAEEYREGKSLLQRCDKLLHCIAEMNSTTESQPSSCSVIPSPVSVLDSGFYKDESSSPSPVMKRSIDFQDPASDLEDETWSPEVSPVKLTKDEEFLPDDTDFSYISDILRASQYLPEDTGVFFLLEKQQYLNGKDTSKVSKLQRKLVFDIIVEIIDRNRQLPPWKIIPSTYSGISRKQIWTEFQKIRERETSDDLLESICSVLKKDLAGNNGWGDQPVEMSESVLDIERLIYKDLVSETIRDLAEYGGKHTSMAPRRKLIF